LNPGSTETPGAVGFYEGLRELGYTEGLNIAIERRYGDSNTDRFQQLAADLVRLKVDVIVVISTSPARAAKQATSIIPIVVGGMADPVGDELIVSLARPGGNITGNTFLGTVRAATYVDKILKGANPADLPVEQPTKLEFVFNLKTARELGLVIPREFPLLADEIIE
jgi:ABC-type uncharacterized transport system substrate-binding protein